MNRTQGANQAGWWNCHSIDCDDNNPSASFSEVSGYYSEPGTGVKYGLLDLAVAMGAYPHWAEAKAGLAARFLAGRA